LRGKAGDSGGREGQKLGEDLNHETGDIEKAVHETAAMEKRRELNYNICETDDEQNEHNEERDENAFAGRVKRSETCDEEKKIGK
jgi:hypothetical protein